MTKDQFLDKILPDLIYDHEVDGNVITITGRPIGTSQRSIKMKLSHVEELPENCEIRIQSIRFPPHSGRINLAGIHEVPDSTKLVLDAGIISLTQLQKLPKNFHVSEGCITVFAPTIFREIMGFDQISVVGSIKMLPKNVSNLWKQVLNGEISVDQARTMIGLFT